MYSSLSTRVLYPGRKLEAAHQPRAATVWTLTGCVCRSLHLNWPSGLVQLQWDERIGCPAPGLEASPAQYTHPDRHSAHSPLGQTLSRTQRQSLLAWPLLAGVCGTLADKLEGEARQGTCMWAQALTHYWHLCDHQLMVLPTLSVTEALRGLPRSKILFPTPEATDIVRMMSVYKESARDRIWKLRKADL